MSKIWVFVVAAVVVVLDRVTKHMAVAHLELDHLKEVTLIPNVLYFTRTSNTGSAFGLFPGSTAILAVVAGLCALCVAVYVLRTKGNFPILLGIGLALPLGGAIGNFYDRAFHHFVVDFIDLYIGTYEWPVFNVADSCICIGVTLIAIYAIGIEKHQARLASGSNTLTPLVEPSNGKAE